MIFAKNDSGNDAAAFDNIGYSMSRHRRMNRFERWLRNWRNAHVKPSPISLPRLVWLICLLCFGVFLMRTGLVFCSSALARRGNPVNEYSVTAETEKSEKRAPLPDVNTGEKGNIRPR
jgi:hypothetical protein